MWTETDRIEVTPLGRYVSRLHRADKRLGRLTYPGLHSEQPSLRKIAESAVFAADNLRGTLRDELARFDGLPLGPGPDDETEATDRHGFPLDYDAERR
jgi:hypothetical protein